MDVHSAKIRSYNMSKIKNHNTKPELLVRHFLFSKGLRYRINVNRLPRHPDIVLPKYKTVILISGCFWHAHENCRYFVMPTTNVEFWQNKLGQNKLRDVKNIEALKNQGWNVIVIWGCQLKKTTIDETLENLLNEIYRAEC